VGVGAAWHSQFALCYVGCSGEGWVEKLESSCSKTSSFAVIGGDELHLNVCISDQSFLEWVSQFNDMW